MPTDGAEAQRADHTRRHHEEDVPAGHPVGRGRVGRQLQLVVTGQRTLLRGFETRELLRPVHLECPLTAGLGPHTPRGGDAVEQHLALTELGVVTDVDDAVDPERLVPCVRVVHVHRHVVVPHHRRRRRRRSHPDPRVVTTTEEAAHRDVAQGLNGADRHGDRGQ